MQAKCCGGERGLLGPGILHKEGCPTREFSTRSKEAAEVRLKKGREDAFRSRRSLDASYLLGKDMAEKEELERKRDVAYAGAARSLARRR